MNQYDGDHGSGISVDGPRGPPRVAGPTPTTEVDDRHLTSSGNDRRLTSGGSDRHPTTDGRPGAGTAPVAGVEPTGADGGS